MYFYQTTKYSPYLFLAISIMFIILPLRFSYASDKPPIADQPDRSLIISINSVMESHSKKEKVILIDVRSRQEFDKLRIPNSYSIPIHRIKYKESLKKIPIILIHNGWRSRSLDKECKSLREQGFISSIIEGGLCLWKLKGGTLEGESLSVNPPLEISEEEYYQDKDYENWMIIDISNIQTRESQKLFPNAFFFPLKESDSKETSLAIKQYFKTVTNKDFSVLVYNKQGNEYEKIHRIMIDAGLQKVFYLRRGLDGYAKLLDKIRFQGSMDEKKTENKIIRCGNCKGELIVK